MQAKFYSNKSDNNTINKILENEKILSIKLKENTDLNNPIIAIKSNEVFNSNYCIIDDLKRCYFVENAEIMSNGIIKLNLRCDVLETYKEELLQCNALITRRKGGDSYMTSDYESEVRKQVDLYYSNTEIHENGDTVLITIG